MARPWLSTLRPTATQPVRVLFLIDNLRPGGAQKALLALVRALKRTGAESAVWCPGGSSRIETDFEALGVRVLGKPDGLGAILAEPFALVQFLRRYRISLVQTFLFHSDIVGRVAGRFVRLVFGPEHIPVVVSSVRATNRRNRAWQYALQRATAWLADRHTSVSHRSLEFAARHEGVRRTKAAVIPNGIDLHPWHDMAPKAEARERLGLPTDALLIGSVGRLTEQKGHVYLLDAARTIVERHPKAFFVIAGYGPMRTELEERAADLGLADRVRFLGFRQDVKTILAALDVFVLPSLWEGMSNAILEAMAAGRAVVATDIDGNVEQVVEGETGRLVPSADADALAEALCALCDDEAQRDAMGRAGRERVEKVFPLERMTDATLDLYAELLEQKAGHSRFELENVMGNRWRMVKTGLTILGKPLRVPTRPLHFQLEPATGCNLRCKMCQVPDYPPDMHKNMTLEQFRGIFDQIRPVKVALSGAGEPFLNPDLLAIIRHASSHGASVLTTTNFTLLSKRIEEVVDSGLSLIKVSLDAARPETYEKIRGRPYHDRIVRDLKELQRVKNARGTSNPCVRLQFVLQHDSVGEIEAFVELAHELAADSVYFQPLETLLVSERKEELTEGITFEGLKASLARARDRSRELGIGTNAGVLVKSLESYFRKYERGVPETPPQRVCLLPWFSLYITVEGNVRPCCSFGEGETLVFGNLFQESFEAIWNNEAYRTFRQDSLNHALSYEVCRNCTPNRLRDFVRLAGVLPGFFGSAPADAEHFEG